jgi:hypothetical protein
LTEATAMPARHHATKHTLLAAELSIPLI